MNTPVTILPTSQSIPPVTMELVQKIQQLANVHHQISPFTSAINAVGGVLAIAGAMAAMLVCPFMFLKARNTCDNVEERSDVTLDEWNRQLLAAAGR